MYKGFLDSEDFSPFTIIKGLRKKQTGNPAPTLYSPSVTTNLNTRWYPTIGASPLYQTEDTSTPVTTVGQSVGRVEDQGAGSHNMLQAVAGNRPTLGDGFLTFDGTNDFMRIDSSAAVPNNRGAFVLYLVIDSKTFVNDATFLNWYTTTGSVQAIRYRQYFSVTNKLRLSLYDDVASDVHVQSTADWVTGLGVYCFQYDKVETVVGRNQWKVYKDGELILQTDDLGVPIDTLVKGVLGAFGSTPTNFSQFDLYYAGLYTGYQDLATKQLLSDEMYAFFVVPNLPAATPDFAATPIGYDVIVDDLSTAATFWEWDWGDGTAHSFGQFPSAHTYSTAGAKTITLTVDGGAQKSIVVTVDGDNKIGYGASTTGGGATPTSYVITTTTDNAASPPAGSLREALQASGARIVTIDPALDVGDGVKFLMKDKIFVNSGDGNLTVDFRNVKHVITFDSRTNRSSNTDGALIQFDGADNVEFLGVNLIPGDEGQANPPTAYENDCFLINGDSGDFYFSQCKFQGSIDGLADFNGSISSVRNVTLERCYLYNPLRNSSHADGAHNFASLTATGVYNISMINCVIQNAADRVPNWVISEDPAAENNTEIINLLVINTLNSCVKLGNSVARGNVVAVRNLDGVNTSGTLKNYAFFPLTTGTKYHVRALISNNCARGADVRDAVFAQDSARTYSPPDPYFVNYSDTPYTMTYETSYLADLSTARVCQFLVDRVGLPSAIQDNEQVQGKADAMSTVNGTPAGAFVDHFGTTELAALFT